MNTPNQQTATTEAKPTRVRVDILLKINVNKEEIQTLLDASDDEKSGIFCDEKNRRDIIAINERHAEEAKAVGLEPTRYEQDIVPPIKGTSLPAVKRADSGVKAFGQNGLPSGSVKTLVDDLEAAGAKLVEAHIQRKEFDNPQKRGVLILGFVGGNAKPGAELTPALLAEIGKLVGRAYGTIHVWKNPPGAAHTVNCTDPVRNGGSAKNALRFLDGEFKSEPNK